MKRLVLTSSFAAVLTASRLDEHGLTFTSADWNPVTYDDGKTGPAIGAYRVGKKYAELVAWESVLGGPPQDFDSSTLPKSKTHFDLVTICPPMVFGPIVHPVAKLEELNDSNTGLWKVASGQFPYPVARVPIWVDIRDVAAAHVEALLRPEVANKRFLLAAQENYSYQRVADILRDEFDWAKDVVAEGNPGELAPEWVKGDGEAARTALGLTYRSLKESVVDAVRQFKEMSLCESKV